MEITKNGELRGMWSLEFPVEDEGVKFIDGSPITKAKIEVAHGRGKAAGRNWVSMSLTAGEEVISGGGYDFKDGKFFSMVGNRIDEDHLLHPIFVKFENHLRNNPEEVKKLTEELKK